MSYAFMWKCRMHSVSRGGLGTPTLTMPAARHPPKQVPRLGTKLPRSRGGGKTTGGPLLCGMTRDRGIFGRADFAQGPASEAQRANGTRVATDSCVLGFIDTKDNPMRAIWNRASILWCRTFHPEPFWPVHGQYRCRACLREYAVPWQEGDVLPTRPATSQAAPLMTANAAHSCS